MNYKVKIQLILFLFFKSEQKNYLKKYLEHAFVDFFPQKNLHRKEVTKQ